MDPRRRHRRGLAALRVLGGGSASGHGKVESPIIETPKAPTGSESEATRGKPSAGGKHLVLVVHGMGDNAPGGAVRPLAWALASLKGGSRIQTEQVFWLPESSARQIEGFPCHVERLREDGAETILAEVFWADLSRLGHGAFRTVLGFFRLIFGLHEVVARHAASPAHSSGQAADPAAELLRKLSLVSAYLLRGPAAAAMLLWTLGLLIGGGLLVVGGDWVRHNQLDWVAGILIVIGLLGLLAGGSMLRRRRGRLDSAFFCWLAIIGALVLAGSWLAGSMPWRQDSALDDSWVFLGRLAIWPQVIAAHLMLLGAVVWAVARLRAKKTHRPAIDLTLAVNFLTIGLWVVAVQYVLTLTGARLGDEGLMVQVKDYLEGVGSGLIFNMALALLGLIVILLTWAARRRWIAATRASDYEASRPAPRILVGGGLISFLISVPVLLYLLTLVPRRFLEGPSEFVTAVSRIGVPLAVLLGGSVIYVSDVLRSIVDFFLDFVSHFERTQPEAGDSPDFVRRERIRERFRIVLKALIQQEEPDEVTIVAHSQGTIVAIEALAEDDAETLLHPLECCRLVTMGSPFQHFYQHYFPSDYPPLDHARWEGLRERVSRWHNIFRIDDYVGTNIEPGGEWPENCPVDPGGHTGYWRDRQVLQILQDRQLV